jgi:regulatory protein
MSKTITALQYQKKNKERVNVFLDGEYAFGLNLMAAAQLRRGAVLSETEIVQLRADDSELSAYQQAVFFLGFRPRSQAEVAEHLRGKEHPPEIIEAVTERLAREGHLDDASFAQFWVENREQFRPRSARALRHELQQKGVARDLISEAVAGLDEEATAWAALEPKLARWTGLEQAEFNRKILGFLGRRGFGYGTIRTVSRRGWSHLSNADSAENDNAENDNAENDEE